MMAAAGVPLRTLQGWMGHADIKTTSIYMHFAPGEDEVQTANRVFPQPEDPADADRGPARTRRERAVPPKHDRAVAALGADDEARSNEAGGAHRGAQTERNWSN
jgi:hypothetical protein